MSWYRKISWIVLKLFVKTSLSPSLSRQALIKLWELLTAGRQEGNTWAMFKWAGSVQQKVRVTELSALPGVEVLKWKEPFSILICLLQRKWVTSFFSEKKEILSRPSENQRALLRNCVSEGNKKVTKPFRQIEHYEVEVFVGVFSIYQAKPQIFKSQFLKCSLNKSITLYFQCGYVYRG